jgi:hypothetical protein
MAEDSGQVTELLKRWGAGDRAALVNEMFLRIVDVEQIDWQDRAHFLGTASAIMRRILVDHA